MNMAHNMLSHKNISDEYWDEVVACSVYMLNGSPTVSVEEKIPEEAWSGTKTSVAYLIIFCYVEFSHIPDVLIRKLDKKSERHIFTSYSEQHKAYKLHNLITKNIVVQRCVVP